MKSYLLKIINTDYFWLILIVIATVYVYLPIFNVFFYVDDLNLLNGLSKALNHGGYIEWLFTPNNQHFIPILKIFYSISYYYFGFTSFPMHIVTLLLHIISMLIFFKISLLFFGNRICSLFFTAIFGTSALFSECVYWVITSSFTLCSIFNFSSLYFLYSYKNKSNNIHLLLSSIFSFLVVLNGAPGLIFPFWYFLFVTILFIENKAPIEKKRILQYCLPLLSWLFAYILYLLLREGTLIGSDSLTNVANFVEGLKITNYAFWTRLVTDLSFPPISLLIFIFSLVGCLFFRKEIGFRYILFLLLYIILNYWSIFTFRYVFGEKVIYWSRYHYIPSFAFCLVYTGIFSSIKVTSNTIKNFLFSLLITILLLHISLSAGRIERLVKLSPPDTEILQDLSKEIKIAVKEISKESNFTIIDVPNIVVDFGPILRAKVPIQFYFEIILNNISEYNIVFSTHKKTQFLLFISNNKARFPTLYNIYEIENYL